MIPPVFIYFILQEKGGTRKTFLTAAIKAVHELTGKEALLVDADLSAGHLLELYADALSVSFDDEGLKEFLSTCSKGLPVIVDVGANSSSLAGLFINAAASLPGFQTVILCPFEDNPKSKIYLLDYLHQYSNLPVFAVAVCKNDAPAPTAPPAIPQSRLLSLPELSGRLLAHYTFASASPAALAAGAAQRLHSPQAVSMRAYLRRVSTELAKVPGLPRFI
jgi:hypothetical protein